MVIQAKALRVSVMLALVVVANVAMAVPVPADIGVINPERIRYWLIQRGEVAAGADEPHLQQAVAEYSRSARQSQQMSSVKMPRSVVEAERRRLQQRHSSTAPALVSPQRVSSQSAIASDVTKTVKVLAVLVDFPNLKFSSSGLSASDTDMYYASYPADHYQDLLFSTSGFTGPRGQTLTSVYQYYQAVSGQSFFFTGTVKGWFTASQNAEYYGGNDLGSSTDLNVAELVKEAVTAALATMSVAELASYDVEDPNDLNSNGNLNEPDGVIDNVMIFHSSIGEESGGGKLGSNAIWSHRYFVDLSAQGYLVPGTGMKLFSYSIQPIDSSIGVAAHEFAHGLGLPDEYDMSDQADKDGSPVGLWSLMSTGCWAGSIAGSQPSGLSPYARSYLQDKYQGRWLKEDEIAFESIPKSGMTFSLNQAINSAAVNQVAIALPAAQLAFKAPYQGRYQYYSGQGNMLSSSMRFSLELPASTEKLTLNMQASWEIETDYDYMLLKVNGVAIAGNHTKASNTINGEKHIITGKSADVAAAEGNDAWVALAYDLSRFAGSSVEIEINYMTDEGLVESGITLDDISVKRGSTVLYGDNAEAEGKMILAGYSRITETRSGASSRYLIQLRSHNGVDAGLTSAGYEPGVLLWLENSAYYDNYVAEHPGFSLIGVIDADQNLIGNRGSEVQLRDAAFSTVAQTVYSGDAHLGAVSLFDDSLDYSAPLQPQSGMVLPTLGLTMEVLSQASDNSTAVIRLANASADPTFSPLSAAIQLTQEGATVSVTGMVSGGEGAYAYAWDFGDGATSQVASPSHTYASVGSYTITLTVTDAQNMVVTHSIGVTIDSVITNTAEASTVSSGGGSLTRGWLMWLVFIVFWRGAHVRRLV